jgi:hypothetical protein
MAALILPSRWTRQPSYQVALASNSFTRGIAFACNAFGGTNRELLSGKRENSGSGTINTQVTSFGISRYANQGSDFWDTPASLDTPSTYTWLVRADFRSFNSNYGGLFAKCSSGTNMGFGTFHEAGNIYYTHNNTYGPTIENAATITGSGLCNIVVTWDGGYLRQYRGGILRIGPTGLGAVSSGNGLLRIFGGRDTWSTTGYHEHTIVWPNRVLSDAEIAEIERSPYLFYQSLNRRIYFGAAAGGGGGTGTASITFAAFTASSTGKLTAKGTSSPTLAAFTSTAAGKLSLKGTASKTLSAFTSTATGKVSLKGTASKALAAFTINAVGGATGLTGALTKTLAAFTVSSTGKLSVKSTSSAVLAALTASSTGKISLKGTSSKTLAAFTVAATGKELLKGTLSSTLAAFTVSAAGTGQKVAFGTASITLGAFTAVSTGKLKLAATGAATTSASISVSGKVAIKATSAASLAPLTVSASGVHVGAILGIGSLDVGAFTVVSSGKVYNTSKIAPTSDVTPGAWLSSTPAAPLYSTVDEAVADDADYDYTQTLSAMRLALGAMSDPGVDHGHSFVYRIKGDGSTTLIARVGAGSTTIATYTHAPAPATITEYHQALTTGEVANFRANNGYSSGWIEFEAA